MSLIRLNDVSVRFENTQILREAFFRLEAGDRVGLIGKNGSGKSTILKLILDQVAPDAGTVTVELGTKVGYFSQFSELNGDVDHPRGARRAVRRDQGDRGRARRHRCRHRRRPVRRRAGPS